MDQSTRRDANCNGNGSNTPKPQWTMEGDAPNKLNLGLGLLDLPNHTSRMRQVTGAGWAVRKEKGGERGAIVVGRPTIDMAQAPCASDSSKSVQAGELVLALQHCHGLIA
eukprot:scaffold255466_cov29-Tisochrysis_lutea.AAC.1